VRKQFSYDLNGELIQSEDVFNGTQHYAYDALGRMTSTRRQRPEYATLLGEATGKSLDKQQALESLFLEENSLYDRADNLYSTGTGQYSPIRKERAADPGWVRFDNVSGRGSELHVPYNRLDAIDDFTFTHDIRGRVKEKRCSKSGVTWRYYYNSDNQLIEAHASSVSHRSRMYFSYDALGRRATSFDGLNETLFIWDGLRLLREERGSKAITYFYEQGSYAPLARVDCRNSLAGDQKLPAVLHEVFYYYCNPAGLPEDVTNSQGEVVWRGRYSTWGKLVYEHTTRHAPAGFVSAHGVNALK
jgi:YD repeat-containing protein